MENIKKKPQTVFLLCGCPGSGKSTWINERYIWDYDALISRDAIRFAKLKPGQDYFAVEDEVKKEFFEEIAKATDPNSKSVFENVFPKYEPIYYFYTLRIVAFIVTKIIE